MNNVIHLFTPLIVIIGHSASPPVCGYASTHTMYSTKMFCLDTRSKNLQRKNRGGDGRSCDFHLFVTTISFLDKNRHPNEILDEK